MKINEVLKKQLEKIKLDEEEKEEVEAKTRDFLEEIRKNIKKNKIKAEVFVGGSLAKGTIVKREKQDIDIFVRFDKKYQDFELSKLLEKLLKIKKIKTKRIHGSRDYFQVQKGKGLVFEIVPTVKISKPEQARNVTDLSYFHVNYIKDKIRQKPKLAEEIMLSKAFSYASNCYGAESYINGFSGYALELLVTYYRGFLNFLKAVIKLKVNNQEKIVLDPKKHYKEKHKVLFEINESKLSGPIIFIDPTFKHRNALAALSYETLLKFKERAKDFLKNPSDKFFEKREPEEKEYNLVVEASTKRQRGDIAGSKLRKFHEFLIYSIKRSFNINKTEFFYDEEKNIGRLYFKVSLKEQKQLLIYGPVVTNVYHLKRFKKKHPKAFIKKGRAYAKQKQVTVNEFLTKFKKENKKIIKDMDVTLR